MQQQSRGRSTTKQVILFVAANPHDTTRLAIDREARSIHVELKRSGHRDRFDFVTRWAPEPLDLLRELRERPPSFTSADTARDQAQPRASRGAEMPALLRRLRTTSAGCATTTPSRARGCAPSPGYAPSVPTDTASARASG